jgi:hypothetical protein
VVRRELICVHGIASLLADADELGDVVIDELGGALTELVLVVLQAATSMAPPALVTTTVVTLRSEYITQSVEPGRPVDPRPRGHGHR